MDLDLTKDQLNDIIYQFVLEISTNTNLNINKDSVEKYYEDLIRYLKGIYTKAEELYELGIFYQIEKDSDDLTRYTVILDAIYVIVDEYKCSGKVYGDAKTIMKHYISLLVTPETQNGIGNSKDKLIWYKNFINNLTKNINEDMQYQFIENLFLYEVISYIRDRFILEEINKTVKDNLVPFNE